MNTSIAVETIKAKLKQELKAPGITDLKCAYIIEKIKLLNMHRRNVYRDKKPN